MAVTVTEIVPNINEKPKTVIESDKTNHKWIVQKSNDGFIFYEIKVDRGNVPKELQGQYSRMKHAVDAVKEYERTMDETKRRRRDKRFEEKEAD